MERHVEILGPQRGIGCRRPIAEGTLLAFCGGWQRSGGGYVPCTTAVVLMVDGTLRSAAIDDLVVRDRRERVE